MEQKTVQTLRLAILSEKENIYIFGKETAGCHRPVRRCACSKDIYDEDPEIAKLVDFIVSDELLAIGDKVCLERLYKEILNKDWFMTLLDLKEYIKTKERVYKDYENKVSGTRSA